MQSLDNISTVDFAGIDLTARQCALVPVAQRDVATLIPIIEEFVLPGTKIFVT